MSGGTDTFSSRQSNWQKLRSRMFHLFFLFQRPMTLGVRAVVHDANAGTVFLVRHTYVSGWHLPGGGVEPGESMVTSLERELEEECNIELLAPPELRSIHFNRQASRRDHVAVYLVTCFLQTSERLRDHEIAEARFFPVGDLPDTTTPATRRRLAEMFENIPVGQDW
ncbi:NUDIX domain-containing protein [Mesorhizobium sp. NBSH29]|uniref:NUDIX domain-containing protein n=1 Tax=Mesorhizobium sp. NBSH29 TaxID=2654249 RepID=UPI0018964C3F|nr:NUDIX domain-containing protein [Mesorhizobium sp. NBSH29]QPC85320.1 NUDIX domain-containing protein [Mesorhizobium sp. NBSH29]